MPGGGQPDVSPTQRGGIVPARQERGDEHEEHPSPRGRRVELPQSLQGANTQRRVTRAPAASSRAT